jgi:hypothetical protein
MDPYIDMTQRWWPTDTAVKQAKAALDAQPDADLAAIPMVQPGKTRGYWKVGQAVETVEGQVFLGVNADNGRGAVPSWSEARNSAAEAASEARGDRPGTVAYAVVARDDDQVAVFEDVL